MWFLAVSQKKTGLKFLCRGYGLWSIDELT